ncbi:MAG: type II and III secretion system protein [Candidatus Hydrogenedentes bacterium]|nr:type II and III secretion system protein [Candidatus Hydrogenedentota bacterium]
MTPSNTFRAAAVLLLLLWIAPRAQAQEQKQVNVAVKIIEFQTSRGSESGLSAYFKQRNEPRPYGRVASGNGNISSAAYTFPSSVSTGLTVLFDNLSNHWGDFEVVLQALVDQNRAFILSQPKVMVPVAAAVPTVIKTTQDVPFENTVVIGSTANQVTAFRPTGVTLTVSALQVVDDDGNPSTTEDVFIQLKLQAEISEEGERITVALDSRALTSSGNLSSNTVGISVPEFVSRSVDTTVWVRNGQVLVMGGLYRNTVTNNTSQMPWLTQGENAAANVVSRVIPAVRDMKTPVTSVLGNKGNSESRRELVFLVKADVWRKSYTVADDFGFAEAAEGGQAADAEPEKEEEAPAKRPGDVISGVLKNLGVTSELGGQMPDATTGGISGEDR